MTEQIDVPALAGRGINQDDLLEIPSFLDRRRNRPVSQTRLAPGPAHNEEALGPGRDDGDTAAQTSSMQLQAAIAYAECGWLVLPIHSVADSR